MKFFGMIVLAALCTTTAFGKNCESVDLGLQSLKIQEIKDLSQNERSSVLEGYKSLKMIQILGCMGTRNTRLSADEAKFAKERSKIDRLIKLAEIQEDEAKLKEMLTHEDLSETDVEMYQWSLRDIPSRMEKVEVSHQEIMDLIKRKS